MHSLSNPLSTLVSRGGNFPTVKVSKDEKFGPEDSENTISLQTKLTNQRKKNARENRVHL